ncbi:MAG: hypothetical protein R3F60_05330 [bacterium]
MTRALLLALALAPLIGCDDAGDDATPAEVPTLASLQAAVLGPSCAFPACHAGPNPKNGLDLSSLSASAAGLIGVAGKAEGTTRVKPGEPDASLLLQVLEGPVGDVRQMPLGFELAPETRARFRAWVAGGAPVGEAADAPPVAEELPPFVADVTPEDLPPPAPGEGFQMGIDTVAPASSEIWKCAVTHLPTDVATPVHRVTSLQTRGVHHMDVMALGLLGLDIEDGMYDCDGLYRQYTELMEEGIFIFASQNEREGASRRSPRASRRRCPRPPGHGRDALRQPVSPGNSGLFPHQRLHDVPRRRARWHLGLGGARPRHQRAAPHRPPLRVDPLRDEPGRGRHHPVVAHPPARRVRRRLPLGRRPPPAASLREPRLARAPAQAVRSAPPCAGGGGLRVPLSLPQPHGSPGELGFGAADEMCQIALVHTTPDLRAACEIVEQGAGPALPP